MSKEKCVRCGDVGYDRRTLWMACLYAMNELSVPFEETQIRGVQTAKTGVKELQTLRMTVPVFAEPPVDAEPNDYRFFTLRVCKDCRGDWMHVIEAWFKNTDVRESPGTGIFVRKNGATVEVSEEEWERENPGWEPVRVLDR